MSRNQNLRFALVLVAAILLLSQRIGCNAIAGGADEQVCDVGADDSLGVENYTMAVRLHREVVLRFPENALAHYHLGFALGMMGDRTAEFSEYRRAAQLGLRNWDLFLNLGLAQLENGDLDATTDSLRQAVLLGGEHSESHLNLALVDERRGMLTDAERETLGSLRLNRKQPDARNQLDVIYAQEGKTLRASLIWRELTRDLPDYEPARTFYALVFRQGGFRQLGMTFEQFLLVAAAVKPADLPATREETRTRTFELNSLDGA